MNKTKFFNHAIFWRTHSLFLPQNSKTLTNMNEYLEKLSAERCPDLDSNTIKLDIFGNEDSVTNLKNLFVARFNRIPNGIALRHINIKKANEWFIREYQDRITECNYTKNENKCNIHINEIFYVLFDDMLVYLSHDSADFIFLYKKTDCALVNTIVMNIKNKGVMDKSNANFFTFCSSGQK